MQYIWEIIKVVIISLLIVIPVRSFLIQPYYVQQESMMPNIQPNNYLIVNRWTYRNNEPKRGDIVVFHIQSEKEALIKRVIGLPGDSIRVSERTLFINGKKLDESSYLNSSVETWGNVEITLTENQYFVLGDNRNHSKDSRHFGPIEKEAIVGKASLRAFPPSQFTRFTDVFYPEE